MTTKLFPVHVACNDPDTGGFAGKAGALCLSLRDGATLLDLEATTDVGFALPDAHAATHPRRLRLSRWLYGYEHSTQWIGNWCWNAYWLNHGSAIKLVRNLCRDPRWSADGGLENACIFWDRKDWGALFRLWLELLYPDWRPLPAPGGKDE